MIAMIPNGTWTRTSVLYVLVIFSLVSVFAVKTYLTRSPYVKTNHKTNLLTVPASCISPRIQLFPNKAMRFFIINKSQSPMMSKIRPITH